MTRMPTAASVFRAFLQIMSWLALLFVLGLDYRVVQYLRYGPDVIFLDRDGRLHGPPVSFNDYALCGTVIVLNVLLVLALHRLHRTRKRTKPAG